MGEVAILPSFGSPLFLLPFVFAKVSSNQCSAEGTGAGTTKSATMSSVGTDDTPNVPFCT